MSPAALTMLTAAVFIMGLCVCAGVFKDKLPPPFDDDRGEEDER